MRSMKAVELCFLVSATFGCQDPTQVRLHIWTDVPYENGREIAITAVPPSKMPGAQPEVLTDKPWDERGEVGTLVLVPKEDRSGPISVLVVMGVSRDPTLCTPSDVDGCIVARRRLRFLEHRTLELPVGLFAKCEGVRCEESETCNALGACVPAYVNAEQCSEPGQDGCFPPDDGLPTGVIDAGADVEDAGVDAEDADVDAEDAGVDAEDAGPGECDVTGELRLWHKVTITCEGPQTDEQANSSPFRNYRMDVTFTNGTDTLEVPGHFAADGDAANTSASSGNRWRAHFMPMSTGTWSYSVSFREGADVIVGPPGGGSPVVGIDGNAGSFNVDDTDKSGRDMRANGLLKYVGGHYLQFAGSGKYLLKQGPDSPENVLAYEDFDGDFKNDGINDTAIKSWSAHLGDWNAGDPTWGSDKGKAIIGAINYLSDQGLNAFSFLTMNAGGVDKNCFPYTDHDERYRMDVSRLDQWEAVFAHGTARGMFLHIKTQERENALLLDNGGVGAQRTLYYREMISRFAHHPALNWDLCEVAQGASNGQVGAWASFFWDHDPYQHPIVLHDGAVRAAALDGPNYDLTGWSLRGAPDTTDFSDIHDLVAQTVQTSAAQGKPWHVACDVSGAPDGLLEAGNEGMSWENGRKSGLWGTLLAGGWGNGWHFGGVDDSSCEDFRSRDGFWPYARHALAFFEDNDIPFWQMATDNALSSSSDDYCFYEQDDTYVVYLKNGGQTSLDLTGATGTFPVRWYDPRNGGSLQTGSVASVGGGDSRDLGSPPSSATDDWVILVRKQAP